jgi:hypothetical protein
LGDIFVHHASEVWSFVGGLVAGAAGGSLLTIHFTRQRNTARDGSIVDQSNATAGGDVVGRDKRISNGNPS